MFMEINNLKRNIRAQEQYLVDLLLSVVSSGFRTYQRLKRLNKVKKTVAHL